MKAIALAEDSAAITRNSLQATRCFHLIGEAGNERGAIPEVRRNRPLPGDLADDKVSVGEEQLRFGIRLPGAEQPTGMIEMQVGEHNDVNVLVREACGCQRPQQDVLILFDPEAIAHLWLEEVANPGLKQNQSAVVLLYQQGATGKWDTVQFVRLNPARPQGTGSIPEHRTPIEALAVSEDRSETRHGGKIHAASSGCEA